MRKITFITSILATSLLICSCVTKPETTSKPPMPPGQAKKIKSAIKESFIAKLAPPGSAFYDDFSVTPNTNWTFYQGASVFTNGILRLTVANNAGMYAYVNRNWTNLSVAADIKLGASSWGAAVGLRYNPTTGANYQAWIYGTGRFTIERYDNWYNTWKEVAGIALTAPGTTTNNVKLSMTNNVLTAYYNGTQRLTYTDTLSPLMNGGAADLGVWGGNAACTADFDNVTVYNLNSTTNPPPVIVKPQIVSMTKRVIGYQGSNMTFTVVGTNNPISYQWCFGGQKAVIVGATNSSLTITNVKTSNAGLYTVYLTNSAGSVYGTANASVFTTNILANCKPITNNTGAVNLAWDASPGSNTIINYNVYYGPASATYTNSISAGIKLTATVSNLVLGGTFYFAATAVDTNALESDYSNEVSTNIPPPISNVITNMTLQIYWLDAFGYPAIQTKMCPFQNATLWYRTNLVLGSWMTATNWIGDRYGNAVYDDAGAKGSPQRFYRASTP